MFGQRLNAVYKWVTSDFFFQYLIEAIDNIYTVKPSIFTNFYETKLTEWQKWYHVKVIYQFIVFGSSMEKYIVFSFFNWSKNNELWFAWSIAIRTIYCLKIIFSVKSRYRFHSTQLITIILNFFAWFLFCMSGFTKSLTIRRSRFAIFVFILNSNQITSSLSGILWDNIWIYLN